MLQTVRKLSTQTIRYNYVKQLYLNELQLASKQINISEIVKPEGNVINWKDITKPTVPKLEATDKTLLDQYILSKPTILNNDTVNLQDISSTQNSSDANTTPNHTNQNSNIENDDDWLIVEEFVDDTKKNLH